ncbi:MAG: LuxR C-terminal-related transcriptional regulator [Bacteroidota bacterium]
MHHLILNKPAISAMTISQREGEILQLLSNGYNSREIADRLFISEFTVQTHRKNMLRKMGFRNFYQLLCWAIKQGVVQL